MRSSTKFPIYSIVIRDKGPNTYSVHDNISSNTRPELKCMANKKN